MNLILFNQAEINLPLPIGDTRAAHILSILRRKIGDTFDAGLLNGPKGKGTLVDIKADCLELKFDWTDEPIAADPITLLIGLPRPQTARKILQEATTMGVSELHFVRTNRSEPSYADSTLWRTGEWHRHVAAGAAQAFCTRVPLVSSNSSLLEILTQLPQGGTRIALDNYEAPNTLSQCHVTNDTSVVMAFGSERGWSAEERDWLREKGFIFAHLGSRVLRLETAVVAALALIKSQRGSM